MGDAEIVDARMPPDDQEDEWDQAGEQIFMALVGDFHLWNSLGGTCMGWNGRDGCGVHLFPFFLSLRWPTTDRRARAVWRTLIFAAGVVLSVK
jgi:hypothetical protein